MKICSKIVVQLSAAAIFAVAGLNAHAGSGAHGDITGSVVARAFESRHLVVEDRTVEKRYRVALASKITLLDGGKGALEDVGLGDEVRIKLDKDTGDIRNLTVISQH